MKQQLIVALLLLAGGEAIAQVNLVRNGGFELYTQCPNTEDQIMLAIGWTPLDTLTSNVNKQGNGDCSADYCNKCSNSALNSVPASGLGYQYPHSGNGMVAVLMYTNGDTNSTVHYVRDYIVGRLTKFLTAGKRYCVSFYVVASEYAGLAIKDLGAYLDNGTICATPYCGVPQSQYTPQVVYTGSPISDTLNWTKIEGSFIATGTERFITIGNFKDRTHTTTAPTSFPSSISYYFVDDVSVVETNSVAYAGLDTHIGAGDSIFIGRTDAAMDCSWTKLGSTTVIGTGAGIWVKPATTTSYVVTQTLCGVVTKDTVKVEVWAAGIQSINGQSQSYDLLPNPNSGPFELRQSIAKDEAATVVVINAIGERVYSGEATFRAGKAGIHAGSLPPGVYYLSLKTKEGYVCNLRFIRE